MKNILLLLAILQLAPACNEVSTDENVFKNEIFGLSVVKPDEWNFISPEENIENLKRAELKDKELQQLIIKYSNEPLVSMMKYQEPFYGLNPSFKININSLGELPGDKPVDIINLMLPQFQGLFKNYELIKKPEEIDVSGHKAAYTKIYYSLQTKGGREFPTCSELWIVPRGQFFFMIGAGTRQDEKTGKRSEIQKILESLKIENLEK